jgi:hypothetical protein
MMHCYPNRVALADASEWLAFDFAEIQLMFGS